MDLFELRQILCYSLKSFNQAHQVGLELCKFLRMNLKFMGDLEYMKLKCNWCCKFHLKSHFEFDQKVLLPLLEPQISNYNTQALESQREIKQLFEVSSSLLFNNLSKLEKRLTLIMKFEEEFFISSILFIQKGIPKK
ncbi:MAG: hypothetical protein R2879_14335 [Saprospiraceae bacterium]